MKITPFRDKVMVLPDPPSEMSAGGIALPVAWTHPPGTGTVIAVGLGRYDHRGVFQPAALKPGDRVSYRWIDGKEFEHDGKTFKFFHENEIFLVTEETKAA